MRRQIILFLMILALSGACFGQSEEKKTVAALHEFWSCVLEDRLENVKLLVAEPMLSKEILEPVGTRIKLIAANRIKLRAIVQQKTFDDTAYVEFEAADKADNIWRVQVVLLKEKNGWKILHLYLGEGKRLSESLRPGDLFRLPIPRGYPINKDCPKCI